jgi:hypothetical protein
MPLKDLFKALPPECKVRAHNENGLRQFLNGEKETFQVVKEGEIPMVQEVPEGQQAAAKFHGDVECSSTPVLSRVSFQRNLHFKLGMRSINAMARFVLLR